MRKAESCTIAQRMVEDGASQPVVLNEDKGVLQRVRYRQLGSRHLKRFGDVHDDKGLVLNDEDRVPVESGALQAAKRR